MIVLPMVAIGLIQTAGASLTTPVNPAPPAINPTPSGPTPAAPQWIAADGDKTTAAVLVYQGGLSLSVLCRDERLAVLIGGLPPASSATRVLQINVPGDDLRNSTWIVGSDGTTAISTAPAVYARRLRLLSQFSVRVPPADGAAGRRYVLPLPETHLPVDTALEACKQPLSSDIDLEFEPELPVVTWARLPMARFPDGIRSMTGSVMLNCVAQPGGHVDACEVLNEDPPHSGFGRAALVSMRTARLQELGGSPVSGPRSFRFVMRFSSLPRPH